MARNCHTATDVLFQLCWISHRVIEHVPCTVLLHSLLLKRRDVERAKGVCLWVKYQSCLTLTKEDQCCLCTAVVTSA
jgi:hypothetical protein